LVPNTFCGWPDRITLTPIVYCRDNSNSARSTLSCTWPERMSASDAGGSRIRLVASTCEASAGSRAAGAPGRAG
jgi:hypothetical protein